MRRYISWLVKDEVWTRDGGVCRYCSRSADHAEFVRSGKRVGGPEFDHIIPPSRGGRSNSENIVLSCSPCNQKKQGGTPEDAGMTLLSVPESPLVVVRRGWLLFPEQKMNRHPKGGDCHPVDGEPPPERWLRNPRNPRNPRSVPTVRAAEPPFSVSKVVAEYVEARSAFGLSTERTHRAMLGKYAKRLLASGRWDGPTLLLAVRAFAATKRSPRFLEEWASEVLTRDELKEHKAQKDEPFTLPAAVLAAMGRR